MHGPNRGDEAAFRGMLYGLEKCLGDVKFIVLTALPSIDYTDIEGPQFIDMVYLTGKKGPFKFIYFTLGVLMCRLWPWMFARLFKRRTQFTEAFVRADIVLSAPAGPYFGDLYLYGEVSNAYNIFLAKLLRKPAMIYAPSMGPFVNKRRNRWRRRLLRRVDTITVRDRYSREHLDKLGVRGPQIHLTADSCLQKPVDASLRRRIIEQEGLDKSEMLIGMAVLDDIPTGNYGPRVDAKPMAGDVIRRLAEVFDGRIVLVPQLYGTNRDYPILVDIAKKSGLGDRVHVAADRYDSDEHQSLIGAFDLFVSFRLHSFIFAIRQGVPAVCVGYEHKAFGFAESMDISQYCLDFHKTNADEIVDKAQQLWKQRESFSSQALGNIKALEQLSLKNSELAADLVNSRR